MLKRKYLYTLMNLLWFLMTLCTVWSSHNVTWDGGYISDDFPERVVEYVYYSTKITWNEAREVCQEIGGDLAKVNSREELDTIVHVYRETYPTINLQDDFWIGLFDTDIGRIWAIDCSPCAFENNFLEDFHQDQRCFKLKANSNFVGERRACSDNSPFMCEIHPGRTCQFIPLIHASVLNAFHDVSYSDCEYQCSMDYTCAAALLVSSSICYHLTSDPARMTLDTATMGSKFCMEFIINDTAVNPIQNDNKVPETSCGIQLESMISVAPVLISPTSTSSISQISQSSSAACVSPSETLIFTVFSTVPISTQCTILSTVNKVHTTTILDYEPCTVLKVSLTPTVNITGDDVLKKAEEISKNLTVNSKKTSSYLRKLTSASDSRTTSTAVGVVGIVSIAIPLLLIMSADVRRLLAFLRLVK